MIPKAMSSSISSMGKGVIFHMGIAAIATIPAAT
jgi:hypothetical protein